MKTSWPCSVSDLKTYLSIDGDNPEKDTLLNMAIESAKQRIENYCQRRFLTATRTYYLNGNGTVNLPIPDWPVSSVTTIHEDTESPRSWDTADLVASDDYIISNNYS